MSWILTKEGENGNAKITIDSLKISVRKTRISFPTRVKGIPGDFYKFPISEYPAVKETVATVVLLFIDLGDQRKNYFFCYSCLFSVCYVMSVTQVTESSNQLPQYLLATCLDDFKKSLTMEDRSIIIRH